MSAFMIMVETPVGTSLPAMDRKLQEIERIVLSQPEVRSGFAGVDIFERGQVNSGVLFCQMVKPSQREAPQGEVVQRLRELLAAVEDVQAFPVEFSFYSVSTEGADWAVAYSIRGAELDELDRLGRRLVDRIGAIPGFVDVDTNLDLEQPQVHVRVDRERAHDLGLDTATIFNTVYAMVAGREVGSFTFEGKRYDVRMKVLPEQAQKPADIGSLMVRSSSGDFVRLDSVVDISHGIGPININRTDRQRSLLLTSNLDGLALNRALEQVDAILAEELPDGYVAKRSGQAEAFQEAMGSLLFAIGLAVLIVYMLLASQFDSMFHPFTIMFALPPAMVGALLALWITGDTLNIMSVIGIILLFGLVTKNSILLVDLTIQRQNAGLDREAALREACPIRLRPILMTAVSMIFGVLPVALALGEGGEARAPMAIATAGGMTTSTLLTLFVVPCVYAYMDRFAGWIKGERRRVRIVPQKPLCGTTTSSIEAPRAQWQMRWAPRSTPHTVRRGRDVSACHHYGGRSARPPLSSPRRVSNRGRAPQAPRNRPFASLVRSPAMRFRDRSAIQNPRTLSMHPPVRELECRLHLAPQVLEVAAHDDHVLPLAVAVEHHLRNQELLVESQAVQNPVCADLRFHQAGNDTTDLALRSEQVQLAREQGAEPGALKFTRDDEANLGDVITPTVTAELEATVADDLFTVDDHQPLHLTVAKVADSPLDELPVGNVDAQVFPILGRELLEEVE